MEMIKIKDGLYMLRGYRIQKIETGTRMTNWKVTKNGEYCIELNKLKDCKEWILLK